MVSETTAEAQSTKTKEEPTMKLPSNKKKIIFIVVAIICALAIAGGIAYAVVSQQQPEQEQPTEEATIETEKLTFKVNAPDWNSDSTPVIAHIIGMSGETLDVYHAFNANTEESIDVSKGTYTVTFISPINTDGSIYKVGSTTNGEGDVHQTSEMVSIKSNEPTVTTFEKIPAEQVTQEQLNNILNQIKEAVSKGDTTLTGDAAATIINTASRNAVAAPQADKEAIAATAEVAKEQAAAHTAATTTNTSSVTNSSTSNNGSSNNGGSAAEPAHQHSWTAITTQTPIYTTINHPAITKDVVICLGCGCENPGRDHLYQHAINGEANNTTVKTITVQAAYSEQVLDHYETTTTGYKCNGCGATK